MSIVSSNVGSVNYISDPYNYSFDRAAFNQDLDRRSLFRKCSILLLFQFRSAMSIDSPALISDGHGQPLGD